jgi:WD40 repeat protein
MGTPRQDPADPYSVRPPKPRFPHPVRITTAALSRDGSILVALDAEGMINGWDVRTRKLLYRRPILGKYEVLQRLTCSPDGRYVALSARYSPGSLLRVLGLSTGEEIRRFDRGYSPAFSPDGEILAATDGPALRRWALKSGAELPVLELQDADLKWVATSPKGDLIAVSDDNLRVAVWNVENRRRVALLDSTYGRATGLAFSPDGATLAIGTHWGVRFWDLNKKEWRHLESHEEYARGQLTFSSDGRRMVAAVRQAWILVWDVVTGRPLHTWRASTLPDGLIEVSEGGDIAIWIERGGMRLERIPRVLGGEENGHVIRSVGFTRDGHAITGDEQGSVRLWDPVTQQELRRISVPPRKIRSFSPDGAWAIYGGGDDPVHLWDLVAGKEVFKVELKTFISAIALSPDRTTMALGHPDGSVSLWDVSTSRERCRVRLEIAGVSAIGWSSDGKKLAWGDELGSVVIAEGSRGAEPLQFKPRGPGGICDILFSLDGKSLLALDKQDVRRIYRDEAGFEPKITGSVPEDIGLDERWNASGFTQKEGTPGHIQMVFSPDKRYVVTATGWGTALIWEAPGGP